MGATLRKISSSNYWRHGAYRRPTQRVHTEPDRETRELLDPIFAAHQQRSFEKQEEWMRLHGFPGRDHELGHLVVYELRKRHPEYPWALGLVAGCLVAAGGDFNFQGNWRIAAWCKLHVRTVQRYRKRLEQDHYLMSLLLLEGDQVEGMKFPARRTHVVRDVSALRRLAIGAARALAGYAPRGRKGKTRRRSSARPSVVDMPSAPGAHTTESATPAEFFDGLASRHPDFAAVLASIADNKRTAAQGPARAKPKAVRDVPPAPLPDELDAIDRELADASTARERPPDTPQG